MKFNNVQRFLIEMKEKGKPRRHCNNFDLEHIRENSKLTSSDQAQDPVFNMHLIQDKKKY